MSKGARAAAAGLLGFLATACAGASAPVDEVAGLKQATVEAIGLPAQAEITVKGQARTVAKWSWQAVADGKTYTCDADQDMRLPSCVVSS